MSSSYHHGRLRAQVLASAAEMIAADGTDSLSLRELARSAGVSHAAPAHHFGDRRGLFTALAAEGFALLGTALEPSVADREFDRTAVAYVRFAVSHPGHFAVMFQADLLDADDPALEAARRRTAGLLRAGLDTVTDDDLEIDRDDARHAAWALVHGVATLWLAGALPGADPEHLAMTAAHQLFGHRGVASPSGAGGG